MSPNEPPTSLTLLGQLRLSNRAAAWAKFDHLYRPLLCAWAQRQGLQSADADDLAQEILLELQSKLSLYDPGKGKFRAWLSTVCKNRCRDFLRRRAAVPPDSDGALSAVGVEPNLTDLEEREHQQALVNRGLELIRGDFNEQTWRIFELVNRDGQKAPEVARALGVTVNAVYLASNRVLTRLRQEINEFLE